MLYTHEVMKPVSGTKINESMFHNTRDDPNYVRIWELTSITFHEHFCLVLHISAQCF